MNVRITRTSDYKFTKLKEVETLEEAIKYIWKYYNKSNIVIKQPYKSDTVIDYNLEIYDDYRE